MQTAPLPDNEEKRLEALLQFGLLDTSPEERFDRITKAATLIFKLPISTLTLVDAKREWFKSVCGLDQQEGDRAISFCGHALLSNGIFVVPDTTKDERFKDNPMVIGEPFIRFYAGVPIMSADGYRIGVFCIKGKEPRDFSKEEEELLNSLASWAQLEINSSNLSLAIASQKRKSEEIDTFFSTSQDIMLIANLDGYLERVNPSFEKLMGYPKDKLLSQPFLDLVHPDDKEATIREQSKVQNGGLMINFVNRYRNSDGRYIWIQWNASLYENKIFATGRDISTSKELETESKIQQERLEELAKKFSFAASSAKIGVWEWDIIEDRYIWDDRMYELYGYHQGQEENASEVLNTHLHPEDKKRFDDTIREVLTEEKDFEISFRVIWNDKSVHYIKSFGSVERNEERVPVRMVGIGLDITKEKESEQHLKQFEAVIRDTEDAIISNTLEGVITGWNPGAERLYGYNHQEIIGKSIQKIFSARKDSLEEMLKKILVDQRISNYATVHKRKNGSLVNVSTTISPIKTDGGVIVGVSIVSHDITEAKEIEKAKTEFISIASHQLRTPVSSVQWNAELLLNGDHGDLNPSQKEAITEIYSQNKRMSSLVNDLLNISRIDLGTFAFNPAQIDLLRVCDETIKDIRPRIEEKGYKIETMHQKDIPHITADEQALRIIFENLFLTIPDSNNTETGTITMSLRTKQLSAVEIEVIIRGAFIKQDESSKLFMNPFHATQDQNMIPQGTGLGLYLVKSIVEYTGGKFVFESHLGELKFSVSYPMPGMQRTSFIEQDA